MSILNTFRNLKFSIFIVFLLLLAITFSSLNINFDFEKIRITKSLQEKSLDLLVSYEDADTQAKQLLVQELQLHMRATTNRLKRLQEQDLIAAMIESNKQQSIFSQLRSSLESFYLATGRFYEIKSDVVLKQSQSSQIQITQLSQNLIQAVNDDIENKNQFSFYLALGSFIYILFVFLWYARKLSLIYKEIRTILDVEEEDRNKIFKTQEFTAIKRRMERRPMSSGGKNLLDPLTSLLNEKGILSEFAQRGGSSKGFVYVTMFDIDNFKEMGQMHGKNFTDAVIKKIAFIINLEKKASDIVGRIGEDQFVMITPRENQAEAFESVDKIRDAVEKTKFKAASEKVIVTLSGGFAAKDKHEKIESAISTANALVKRAKTQGKNTIVKPQGFSNDRNSRM